MSLNKEFKQLIIDNLYYRSAFDGKQHNPEDLQICHILSNSKRTRNCIKKAYGCSDRVADIITNMPLLNTVVGSRKDNAEYKKTDDIVYIDREILTITHNLILDNQKHFVAGSRAMFDFYSLLGFIRENKSVLAGKSWENYLDKNKLKELEISIFAGMIKDIQNQFHKEIDLHF